MSEELLGQKQPPVIHVENLIKQFGDRTAVAGVNFKVFPGECLAILGPNGAGKTTTIKTLSGLVNKTEGTIQIFGMSVPEDLAEIKKDIGIVPQADNLDLDLTVIENLVIYASYFGIKKKTAIDRAKKLLSFLALSNREKEIISNLSGGQRRRIILARALINKPRLLILDEPTIGLDPLARLLIWERLEHLKSQGTTMLLTSHYMEEVSRLSDRVLILEAGRSVAEGKSTDLINKFIGPEVFEIELPDDRGLDHLKKELYGLDVALDEGSKKLYIYPKDKDRAKNVEKMVRQFPGWIRRPSNLEDVFLRLTGRCLKNQ